MATVKWHSPAPNESLKGSTNQFHTSTCRASDADAAARLCRRLYMRPAPSTRAGRTSTWRFARSVAQSLQAN